MSFAVLHVTKFAGSGSGGIGAHIDRKHTPKNADPARTELNREIIPPRSSSMKKDIDERIQEGYTSTRKIRTDAVRAVGVILSGSHEQMKKIQASGRLDEWCQANLKFAQDKFGKDNLIRFTLHMDEKTPHGVTNTSKIQSESNSQPSGNISNFVGKTVQNVPLISAKMCHEPRPDFEKIATVMPLSVSVRTVPIISVRIVPFWRAA